MAANKYIALVSGKKKEVQAKDASAGVGDAGKLVALDSAGVLDSTIVNSVTSSGGAGDSAKLVALDGSGKIDASMMPVGIGADTKTITASENLAAGDFVDVWDDSGTLKARKADATTAGKEAVGFVLASVTSGASGAVYFEGTNTGLSGLTIGSRYYLSTTAGGVTVTPPSGSGAVVQYLGRAISATEITFEPDDGVEIA